MISVEKTTGANISGVQGVRGIKKKNKTNYMGERVGKLKILNTDGYQ